MFKYRQLAFIDTAANSSHHFLMPAIHNTMVVSFCEHCSMRLHSSDCCPAKDICSCFNLDRTVLIVQIRIFLMFVVIAKVWNFKVLCNTVIIIVAKEIFAVLVWLEHQMAEKEKQKNELFGLPLWKNRRGCCFLSFACSGCCGSIVYSLYLLYHPSDAFFIYLNLLTDFFKMFNHSFWLQEKTFGDLNWQTHVSGWHSTPHHYEQNHLSRTSATHKRC